MSSPSNDRELDTSTKIVSLLVELRKRIVVLETQQQVTIIVKTDTGDPTAGATGQMIINTVDNTLKQWADGAWRQLATW